MRLFAASVTLLVAASPLLCSEEREDLAKVSIPESASSRKLPLRDVRVIAQSVGYFMGREKVGQRDYYKSGTLAEEQIFRKGKPHGIHKQFWPTGKLFCEKPYREGILDGTVRYFDADGDALGTSEIKLGSGVLREFEQPTFDSRTAVTPLHAGVMHGARRVWSNFGECGGSGCDVSEYVKGKLDGWSRVYCGNGTIRSSAYCRTGKLHGVYRVRGKDGALDSGFPKYYLRGEETERAKFEAAAKTDAVLQISLKGDEPDEPVDITPPK